MTISTTTTPYHNYTGNGSVDDFAVTNFKILRNSDNTHAIQVYKTVIATGIATLLAETTDYTVALDSTSPSTGTVTLVAGNLPSTHRISIIPSLPKSQEVNLQNAAVIDVEDIESALDKLTLIVQSNQEQLSRAIVFGEDTLERNTQMSNLTSDQVDTLITQLNTLATSDNSISDFSIDSLTAATLDPAADYIPFHDATDNTMKKALIPLPSADGDVLDVQYTNKSDTASITASSTTSWYDITGMTVSTTPDAATDSVIIGGVVNLGSSSNSSILFVRVVRSDGKVISELRPTPNSGLCYSACSGGNSGGMDMIMGINIRAIDEQVGTTAALTYKLQVQDAGAASTLYVNRSDSDTDGIISGRAFSQINLIRLAKTDNSSTSFTGLNVSKQFLIPTQVGYNTINITDYINALGHCDKLTVTPQNSTSKVVLLSAIQNNASGAYGYQLKSNNSNVGTFTSSGDRQIMKVGVTVPAGASPGSYNPTKFCDTVISAAGVPQDFSIIVKSTSTYLSSGNVGFASPVVGALDLQYHIHNSFMLGLSLNTSITGSMWKQVVSATNSAASSTSVNADTNLSAGTAVTITPQSASSTLILLGGINACYSAASDSVNAFYLSIDRDGSPICVGDAGGSRVRCTYRAYNGNEEIINYLPIMLMIPATSTSATTITPNLRHGAGSSKNIHINRSATDSDSSSYIRTFSELHVIEVLPS